jgi:hypothetical protein
VIREQKKPVFIPLWQRGTKGDLYLLSIKSTPTLLLSKREEKTWTTKFSEEFSGINFVGSGF